jgi:hypothetical protein
VCERFSWGAVTDSLVDVLAEVAGVPERADARRVTG